MYKMILHKLKRIFETHVTVISDSATSFKEQRTREPGVGAAPRPTGPQADYLTFLSLRVLVCAREGHNSRL